MVLNPFIYETVVRNVDKRIEDHLKPFIHSRPAKVNKNIQYWENLTPDQKEYIIRFVEKNQKDTIAKAMMRLQSDIPVPRIGIFRYSPAKYYSVTNREELNSLSKEERKERIVSYHIANKRKNRFGVKDGTQISFAKNIAKR